MEKNRSLKYHLNNVNELIDCMLNDEQFSPYDLQQLQEHLRKLCELVNVEVSFKFEVDEKTDNSPKNQHFAQSFKEEIEKNILIEQPFIQNNGNLTPNVEDDINSVEENKEDNFAELPYHDDNVELDEEVVADDIEEDLSVPHYDDNVELSQQREEHDESCVENVDNEIDVYEDVADEEIDSEEEIAVDEQVEEEEIEEEEIVEEQTEIEEEQFVEEQIEEKQEVVFNADDSFVEEREEEVLEEEDTDTVESNEYEEAVYGDEEEDSAEDDESGDFEEDVAKCDKNDEKMPFLGVKNDNSDVQTIADVIGKQYEQVSIGEKIGRANSTNLKNAIDISDKFMFIKNLFDNDVKAYNETIEKFNSFSSKNDAMIYLQLLINRYEWDYNSRIYQKFELIISRKFEA